MAGEVNKMRVNDLSSEIKRLEAIPNKTASQIEELKERKAQVSAILERAMRKPLFPARNSDKKPIPPLSALAERPMKKLLLRNSDEKPIPPLTEEDKKNARPFPRGDILTEKKESAQVFMEKLEREALEQLEELKKRGIDPTNGPYFGPF